MKIRIVIFLTNKGEMNMNGSFEQAPPDQRGAVILEFQHPQNEGVSLDGPEAPYNYREDPYNPIHKQVPGLGEVQLLSREMIEGKRKTDEPRPDSWYLIELDGYKHAVRVTEPIASEDVGINFVHLPGLSEEIEKYPGYALHTTGAEKMPYFRFISIASDGVGSTGERLTRENVRAHGIEAMAEERAKLISALCSDEPTIVQGTSMGSVITTHMLDHDIRNGRNLNVYPMPYASANVTPDAVPLFMATLFMPSMLVDTPREMVYMVIKNGWHALDGLVGEGGFRSNVAPILVEIPGLMKGIKFAVLERVYREYGATIINGQLDPLARWRMWRQLSNNGADLNLVSIFLRGHGMAANGIGAARKIESAVASNKIVEKLAA